MGVFCRFLIQVIIVDLSRPSGARGHNIFILDFLVTATQSPTCICIHVTE